MSDSRAVARTWWWVLAVVVAASVLTEFGRAVSGANVLTPEGAEAGTLTRVIRFWSYFTIQSNLLVFLSVLPLLRDPGHDGRGWRVLRLDAVLGITVTGLVYAVVLGPDLDPVGLGWWTNAGLHYAAPVLTVVGWALFGPRPRVTLATTALALVWPVAWLAYTLVHGAVSGWYPYPFIDVDELGYAVALRNAGGVVVLAVVFLLLIRVLDTRLPRTPGPARRQQPQV